MGFYFYPNRKYTYILWWFGLKLEKDGHPAKATVVSLAKQVIFYIPAMVILAKIFGLIGILLAGPVAEVLLPTGKL